MAEERIFVGRKAEVKRFDELLRNPAGQAILVVGRQGMGSPHRVLDHDVFTSTGRHVR